MKYKIDYTNGHFGISHVIVEAQSRNQAIEQVHEKYNDYMIINIQQV